MSDCAGYVVEEMLEKYGIDRSEATGFCLVQCTTQTNSGPGGDPSAREYYLEDEECPLAILMNHPPSRGNTKLVDSFTFPINLNLYQPNSNGHYFFI